MRYTWTSPSPRRTPTCSTCRGVSTPRRCANICLSCIPLDARFEAESPLSPPTTKPDAPEREDMGKIARFVEQHSEDLLAIRDDHTKLWKFTRTHRIGNHASFPLFKKELLSQLGIDYDALRGKSEHRKRGLLAEAAAISKSTPLVIPENAITAWRSFHHLIGTTGRCQPTDSDAFIFPQFIYQVCK